MQLPIILGWPGAVNGDGLPAEFEMRDHIERTMPIAYIAPCHQKFQMGLEIYDLVSAWTSASGGTPSYAGYMSTLGFELPPPKTFGPYGPYLSVMYNDITAMGESYSNSFSQSSHQDEINNAMPQDLQDLMFLANGNAQQLTDKLKDQDGFLGGMAAGAQSSAADASQIVEKVMGKKFAKGVAEMTRGTKIDMPMFWRGSSWSAEYTLAIRLYCPSVKDDDLYNKLIVGPYAALTALALPKTVGSDNFSYQWPFLVQLFIPGVVNLRAGYVSSLSVLKGGDVNDRAWIGRPNIIDLRMTVSPLYSTALLPLDEPKSGQPTLLNEVQTLNTISRDIELGGEGGYVSINDATAGNVGPHVGPVTDSASTNTEAPSGPTPAQQEAGAAMAAAAGAGSG